MSLWSSLWSLLCGVFLKHHWVHHLFNKLIFVSLEFLSWFNCPPSWLLLKRHSDYIKDPVKGIPMSGVSWYPSKVFSTELHCVLTCWRTWIGTGICVSRLQHTLSNYRSAVTLWVSAILSWLLQLLIGILWFTILQILKYASTAVISLINLAE